MSQCGSLLGNPAEQEQCASCGAQVPHYRGRFCTTVCREEFYRGVEAVAQAVYDYP